MNSSLGSYNIFIGALQKKIKGTIINDKYKTLNNNIPNN